MSQSLLLDNLDIPFTAEKLKLILLDDRIRGSLLLTGAIHGAIKEIEMLREIKHRYDSVSK